jgi:hypothetical protein
MNKVEAAIEETCRFLERYTQSESWKADPDGFASDMRATIEEVEGSDLPDGAKNLATWALYEQTKKRRRGKPTRKYRNMAIQLAAMRLVTRGYRPTRNESTRGRASASSIVRQALDRLGETMAEKSINAVVAKACRDAAEMPEFFRDVLK